MPDKNQHQKLINARLMKWREMLQKGLYSDKQLLIKRTHKGIPPSIRIVVWPEISKLKNFVQRQPLTYSKVLLKDSRDIYEIKLDVPRTFSFQSQQVLRQSLFNVLKALSVQFPHIGYCQGMNFLSMRLLQILDDETVFYVISCILKKNKSIYDNFRNPGFVNRQNEVFSIYLQKFMPKLNKKLKEHFIQPYMYTTQWFLTLFSKSLDKQKFYRFFQCFLVDGYATIYKAGLTLMKFKQKQILDNGMQENILFISDMEFYNKFNDDQFIKQMLKFQLNLEEIQKIQKQYSYRNKATFKKLQDTVMTTYTKKIQEPRNIFEWTLQDFKKTDFQYVSFDD